MKTSDQIASVYQQIIYNSEVKLREVRQRILIISLLRVALFVMAMTAAFIFWSDGWLKWCMGVLVPFLFFIWLVKQHNQWFNQKEYLQKKIEINKHELESLQGDYSAFDGGEEFVDSQHLYTFDLDVFGRHSLFQSINRTSTPAGKHHLANWLKQHLLCREDITARQEAIRELTPELDFRQRIRLLGLFCEGKPADVEEITAWASEAHVFRQRQLIRFLPWCSILLNIICITLAVFQQVSLHFVGLVFLSFVLLSTLFAKKITRFQEKYGKSLQVITRYADLILLIENKTMHSQVLQDLKRRLICRDGSASQIVYELSQLMNTLDQRNNILVSTVLNGLFMWELWQVMRIELWREKYASELSRWIDVVGEMEAYCSVATYAYNHPDYVYPVLTSTPFELRAKALGHPLMSAEKCVRNEINIAKKPFFVIITGANMAGKSTYLRTVGVNYLLACIGAPVWAEEMCLYPSQLVTSLRTTDSLAANESYFFAELKGLKRIIDILKEGSELFIILDEILKGTNSMDKQKGSLALVRQFMQMNANGMIATHDLLLGSLENAFPQHIKNYCFEADITNDELTFSYRIREGIAQNMNACFLMKKMGIVDLN